MIFCANLGVIVKKSQGDKAYVTNMARIAAQLPLDANTSNMDAAILGPKDLVGPNGPKMQAAVDNKHPSVCVIYIYTTEKEAPLLNCQYKKLVKKITPSVIDEIVTEFLGNHIINSGNASVESRDLLISPTGSANVPPVIPVAVVTETVPENTPPLDLPQFTSNVVTGELTEETPDELFIGNNTTAERPMFPDIKEESEKETFVENKTYAPPVSSIVADLTTYKDFDLLKARLQKDKIVADVLKENADYISLTQMLDILDANIRTAFIDMSKTPAERFQALTNIGLQRTEFTAKANQMVIDKTINMFDMITRAAVDFVEHRSATMEKTLLSISTSKAQIEKGQFDIETHITERTALQLELLQIRNEIVQLFAVMDDLTAEELSELDKDLPSSYKHINEVLSPTKHLFTPANAALLASKLMKALNEKRLTLSSVESKVQALISTVGAICAQTDEIIQYQAALIKYLRANKVEDIVIVDQLIKGVLRLFVAEEDTGATATLLTHSGILSRRGNTLIIDLSNTGKWEQYGESTISWSEFIADRPEKSLCIVKAKADDPEQLQEIIMELKKACEYYQYINLKLDHDQTWEVQQLSEDALSIAFISNCRKKNIGAMFPITSLKLTDNIAKKLILIDAPENEIFNIATSLGLDITQLKIIAIPHITAIKSCALLARPPYTNTDIADAFKGAFK